MKKSSNLLIVLICILGINLVGCSNNKNSNVDNLQKENQTTNEITNTNNTLTKDEYRDTFVKNYEKYISPIDFRDEQLDDILDKNNDLNNEQLIENYKALLSDSKTNIKSFCESLKDLKIEDSNLQNLNNALVENCDKVISDIKLKEENINSIDPNLVSGDKIALMDYLEKELDKDIKNEESFDNTLEKIENNLGIDLDNNK